MEQTSEVTPPMDESHSISPAELLRAPQANPSYVKFAGPAIRSLIEEQTESET